ncbi:MAG: hypothetical protein J6A37_00345 [Oscillospiraceae bacterium]|nr:hypothetical protein [Oscillospiraceae bacterium]
MKNRFLSGIALAFHSMGIYAAAAIIIRMVIAIAKVHEYGAEVVWGRDDFGDGYSLIILFFLGAFMYRRHRGLSAAVNLSSGKSVVTWSIAAVFISVSFALFDIAMVKLYFNIFSVFEEEGIYLNTLLEYNLITSPQKHADLFSKNGLLLLFKTTLIYHCCILAGYSVRHIFGSNPKLTIMWVIMLPLIMMPLIELVGRLYVTFDLSDIVVYFFLALFLLFAYIMASPLCFIVSAISYSVANTPIESVSMMLLMWLGGIAAAVRLVSRYKSDIPKEKRKDMII